MNCGRLPYKRRLSFLIDKSKKKNNVILFYCRNPTVKANGRPLLFLRLSRPHSGIWMRILRNMFNYWKIRSYWTGGSIDVHLKPTSAASLEIHMSIICSCRSYVTTEHIEKNSTTERKGGRSRKNDNCV